jgi:hypothetical protein
MAKLDTQTISYNGSDKLNSNVISRINNFTSALMVPIRQLTKYENNKIVDIVKEHSKSTIPLNEFVMYISLKAFDLFTNIPIMTIEPEDDIHTILKNMINEPGEKNSLGTQLHNIGNVKKKSIQPHNQQYNLFNFQGLDTLLKFAKAVNPQSVYKNAYVTLDSKYAKFLDGNTKLQWDYLSVLTETDTSTNTNGTIRDIVSMQIYSSVLTKFDSVQGRATTLVEEFKSQAFIAPSGRRYHTMGLINDLYNPGDITIRGLNTGAKGWNPDITFTDKVEILSGFRFNEGIYHFNQPITTFDSLTLSFGDPYDLIPIQKHIINRCSFDSMLYTSLATLPDKDHFGNFDIDTHENHYFTGELYSIKISEFTTSDPVTDDLYIRYVNSMEFSSATVIDDTHIRIYPREVRQRGPGPLTLEYNAPSIPATPTGIPSQFTMTFDSYRIITNIKFTYIDPNFGR